MTKLAQDHNENRVNLADRLALRPREVAEMLGVSERTIRQILPELPTVRIGSIVLVPTKMLEKWLEERVEREERRLESAVEEVLRDLGQ